MKLKPVEEGPIHLSHLHRLVSAYETNRQTVVELATALREGVEKSKRDTEVVVVDQDSMEHVFICLPSGKLALYRLVQVYEICDED